MDRVRAFCDEVRDRLLESIESAPCLTPSEKRVLQGLWSRSTVRTQSVEEYGGNSTFARELGLTPKQIGRSLYQLERKGFIKATGSVSKRRQLSYLLNAMILESAYDETVQSRPRPPQS